MKDLLNRQTVHDEVLDLLPWFVNGTLVDKEQLKVMSHLGECLECQKERDRLQQLQTLVQSDQGEDFGDYKPAFEKLMDRIDAQEADVAVPISAAAQSRSRPNWMPYAAAASLVLGASLLLVLNQPEPAQTLNVPASTQADFGVAPSVSKRMTLMFDENVDSETLRAAFVETGAYIVSGPDADGRYVVEVFISDQADQAELVEAMTQVAGVKYAAVLD